MCRTLLLVLVAVCLVLPGLCQENLAMRPYRYEDSQEYLLPFYMQKKTLSEKMRSVKGRITGTHLRDTLFG